MAPAAEQTGTLTAALEQTTRLLRSDPVLASEQAGEILKVVPGHPMAILLLGVARRAAGDAVAALEVLEPLSAAQPNAAAVHYEMGITLVALDRRAEALTALRRAIALKPDMPDAWREIGDLLMLQGDAEGADAAYAEHIKASTQDPRLMAAAHALCENKIGHAELLLREHLKRDPTDVAAIRMFAEVAGRLRRYRDAENLLVRCLELAPEFQRRPLQLCHGVVSAEQADGCLTTDRHVDGKRAAQFGLPELASRGTDEHRRIPGVARDLCRCARQTSGSSENLDELWARAGNGGPADGEHRGLSPLYRPVPRRWARRTTASPTSKRFVSMGPTCKPCANS